MLAALVCARLYFSYPWRGQIISTSEWVQSMRKNDHRLDRAARARAAKACPAKGPVISFRDPSNRESPHSLPHPAREKKPATSMACGGC